MTSFTDETLELFKGSLSKVTPLKRFKWVNDNERLPEEFCAIRGECRDSGVLRLSFDVGLKAEIEGIRLALINRGKKCSRPAQFGYGGQYAFFHYLNYFMDFSEFRFQYDCVFGSSFNLPFDFRIFFPHHKISLEIKTVPPKMSYCRYFKTDPNPFPDYAVCIKALDEEMLTYELYGYCTGSDVQKIEPKLIYGKPCYEIPAKRGYFKPYNDFHTTILRLPVLEKFDNERYVQP